MAVSEFIEDYLPMGESIAKAVNRTRFAGIRAMKWSEVAAVVALLAWICALSFIQRSHRSFVESDAIIHYFPAAQRLLEGEGYRAFEADVYRSPGYSFALAVVTQLLRGDMFASGKVISVMSSVLFLLFSYLLLRRIFDSVTALAAVLLTMGANTFAWASCANGTHIPFACLAMASLYFTARHDRPRRVEVILAGFLAGLALSVRWTGLLLPLFMLTRVGLVPEREFGMRSRIQITLLYLLGFLLTSGPWFCLNYLLDGSPLYNRDLINLDAIILRPLESPLDSPPQTLIQKPLGFGLRSVTQLLGSSPLVIQALHSYPVLGGWLMVGWFWLLILLGLVFLLMQVDRLKLWFLLIFSLWSVSLVPIHFEARFYTPLIPALSALTVFVVTSNSLPDLRLTIDRGKWAKLSRGYLLDRIIYWRLPPWLIMSPPSGTSLTSLVLIGFLAAWTFSTVQRVRGGYEWESERHAFYHELARFIHRLQGPGLHRPIGAPLSSHARYWIPREAGTPVAPLPADDYESVLPGLSYVLYDQIDDEHILPDSWDDSKLGALADPLRAPGNLEAVYYKPDPYGAILYRILEQASRAEIVAASASSGLSEHGATRAFDNDAQTWWSSALHASENALESITFDLGRSMVINRVWLLPRPDGEGFPAGLRIDVSQDDEMWQPVVEAEKLAEPAQHPRIFELSERVARLVRITATRLRWDEDEQGYLVSLAEARISFVVERSSELPLFSIAPSDLLFDPLSDELVARVHNQSGVEGQATVEFYKGWSAQDAEYLATVKSSVAEPGRLGVARVSSSEWTLLKPGHCRPIWATLESPSYGNLALDTYGITRAQPSTVFSLVCSPKEVIIKPVIDHPEDPESLPVQGWTIPPDQTATGVVTTTHDEELGRQVMGISTDTEAGFLISRCMRVYDRPELTLWIRSAAESEKADVIAKDVLLLLDTSTSMQGEKVAQAKVAVDFVLDHLRPQDRFNIFSFSGCTHPFARRPQPVSERQAAHLWVAQLKTPRDGTDINSALLEVLAEVDPERPTILILLSDGQANEGITDPTMIMANVAGAAGKNVCIFSVGVGHDANTTLLDGIVQVHCGASTYVTPDKFAEEELSALYAGMSTPLLATMELHFTICVEVRALDGERYHIHYVPCTWHDQPNGFLLGRHIYYPLGSHLTDGRWHRLERDIFADFSAKTGGEIDYIEEISVRTHDDLELADLTLGIRK